MSAIKVGDLVQVVQWPCCGIYSKQIRVAGAYDHKNYRDFSCEDCGAIHPIRRGFFDIGKSADGRDLCAPAEWLKKVPPLSELEIEKKTNEVTA